MRRRTTAAVTSLLGVLFLACGAAFAATVYRDRVGDVQGGAGPDIASITLSSTKTTIGFRVRFVTAPPLRANMREGWVDMLLIGIDVPPLGPRPVRPGGEWRGANFAVGTHGPSKDGLMVRLGEEKGREVVRFRITTSGSSLSFSIPRRALGNPTWFTFSAAAAREAETDDAAGAGVDVLPGRGTLRYTLAAGS